MPALVDAYPSGGLGLAYGFAFVFLVTFVFGILVYWITAIATWPDGRRARPIVAVGR